MAKYHDSANLMAAGLELVEFAKNKDFTSKAALDCAFEAAGCANDLRSEDGPIKFTAAKPVAVPKAPADAVKLAQKIEKDLAGAVKVGATAGGEKAELNPLVIQGIWALIQFFLSRAGK